MTSDTSRRALITGATGFVGTHLTDLLTAEGWDVYGCDIKVPEPGEGLVACDISHGDAVRSMVASAGAITHIFHLAAVTFLPDAEKDPTSAFRVNVEGTIHLAEAALEQWPAARFIYISTAEVYGHPQNLPLTETHPIKPVNPYAISKTAADHYCRYLYEDRNAAVVRMRPFNHAGPGQAPSFVLSDFAKQVAAIEAGQAEPVLHVGDLDSRRDFSHVSDVVRAYRLAALKGKAGEAYNVCSGKSHAIGDVVDILRAQVSVHIEVKVDEEKLRPSEIRESVGSYAKLEADTEWKPEKTFEELLHDLLDYWRKAITSNVA